MRIALYHNLPSGGAKRAVFEWTKRLAARATVDEYTLSTSTTAFCDIRSYVQDRITVEFVPHRLFESPLGRLNRLQRLRDLQALGHLSRKLAEKINRGSYDVVFAHPCLYTFVPPLLSWLEVPSVYYFHEGFGPGTERRFSRPYIDRRQGWLRRVDRFDPLVGLWRRRVEAIRQKSLASVTRLLSNSAYTREQMEAAYQVTSFVCRYGVDCREFRPLEGIDKEPSVISVGELTPRKGFDFVIESLALIKQNRPRLKLVYNFVDPDEKAYLEDLAKRLGVEIQLLSNLGTEELAQEYSRSLLCLYAPIGEPFGLVPLESMACGTPVVAVAEGGIVESVVDGLTGRLTSRNHREFAEATRLLLADESLRRLQGKSAREHVVSKWSWELSTDNLFAHLYDAASRSSPMACRRHLAGVDP